ncbi:MAG TPA: hypothetical protein VGD98_09820 [Ktedonobacteraceae bacterium]
MEWRHLIRTMRQLRWDVVVSDGWVGVETRTGEYGDFEESAKGLQEARRFYRQYSAHPSKMPFSQRPRRVSSHTQREPVRFSSLAWPIVAFFAFILLSAVYCGVISPPLDRLTFGVIAVVSLVVIEGTRRVCRLW